MKRCSKLHHDTDKHSRASISRHDAREAFDQPGPVSLGLGYFVPRSQNYVPRESLNAGTRSDGSEWQIAASVVETQHAFGAGIGHQVSQRMRLGVSLIGGYNALQQSVTLFGAVHRASVSAANTFTTIGTSSRLSVELGLGMQLELSDAVVIGVTLRSPQLLLYAVNKASANTVIASAGGSCRPECMRSAQGVVRDRSMRVQP
ncbi:MAG TPA: hypothetical protein VJV78_28600 [Polyangiales bacterium]|nr:hypothetical protein [Polyangiales bacterium]